MIRHREHKDRPSIGEHLLDCEERSKYHLPPEVWYAWIILIGLAVAKYYLTF